MRIILGTILLIGFLATIFKNIFDCIDGCYKKTEEKAARAGWLYRHGIIRKVK